MNFDTVPTRRDGRPVAIRWTSQISLDMGGRRGPTHSNVSPCRGGHWRNRCCQKTERPSRVTFEFCLQSQVCEDFLKTVQWKASESKHRGIHARHTRMYRKATETHRFNFGLVRVTFLLVSKFSVHRLPHQRQRTTSWAHESWKDTAYS